MGGEAQASPPDPPTMTAAVALRGITKRFPAVVANDQVDFEAAVGEVHALLGENGAGKTTLSNILTGLYRPDEGAILLSGRPVDFHSPRDAITLELQWSTSTFGSCRPSPSPRTSCSVTSGTSGARFWCARVRSRARVEDLSRRYGLAVDPRARIWQFSVGEQQRVEVLKALYQDARILILDEPTAVLTPQEADALFETVRAMAADGRTVIFISHKLHEVKAVADRVTVLRRGQVGRDSRCRRVDAPFSGALMVGREVEIGRRHHDRAEVGEAVLELDAVWADGDRGIPAVRDVSLQVRGGEIVGIAGVAGNGQRELAETIVGMRPVTKGTIEISGRRLRGGDPRSAISAGVAYVPEDRLGTGVAPGLSIASNVVLKSYRGPPVSSGPFLRFARIRDLANRAIDQYDVRTSGVRSRPGSCPAVTFRRSCWRESSPELRWC